MADVSYESLQSQIQTQKTQITSQRGIIQQQKTAGTKGIESLRRVHPKTTPSEYYGQIKPRIEAVKGQLGELESAEQEINIAEQKLQEQETLLAERKAEGYKIREKGEGEVEFYKEVYTPGERVQVGTREVSVMVHWVNPKTGKTGRFQGRQSNMADYERQLGSTGRQITEVTTIGGGEPIYKETEGYWTTKDVILWQAPPIIKEPIKTIKEIDIYTQIYGKIPESIVKERVLPTPEKFAVARGVPSDVFKEYTAERLVTATTREMTQAEITVLLSKMSKEEKLVWYKEHAEFGVVGEEKKSWSEIKKENPFWELTIKDSEPVIETPDTSERLLLKWHRAKYKDVEPVTGFVGKYSAALIHGTFDPEFWIKLVRGGPERARVVVARGERRVEPLIKEGKWGEYAWSVVTSPGYTNIVLPFVAGAGIGAAFKGIGLAAKGATGVTGKVLTKFATKTPYVYGGIIAGMVGTDIGYTAAMEEKGLVKPDTTLAKISRYGMQFTFAGLGAKWATSPKTAQAARRIVSRKFFSYRGNIEQPYRYYQEGLKKYEIYDISKIGVKPSKIKGRLLTIKESVKPVGKPRIDIYGKPKYPIKIPKSFVKVRDTLLNPDYYVRAEKPVILAEYVKAKPSWIFRKLGPRIFIHPRPVFLGGLRAMVKGRVGPVEKIITPEKLPGGIPEHLRYVAARYQAYKKLPTDYYYRGDHKIHSILETFPKVEISTRGDINYLRQVNTEVGTYLEYTISPLKGQKFFKISELHYADASMMPETATTRYLEGTGQIFKPKMPGYYKYSQRTGTFMGEKQLVSFIKGQAVEPTYIGPREAVDTFWGKVYTKTGIGDVPEMMIATGKLYIPSKLIIKGVARATPITSKEFGKGYPSFEAPPKSSLVIENIDRVWYQFQTQAKTTTSGIGITKGLGRTFPEFGYKVKSYHGGYEIEVTPYRLMGRFEYKGITGPVTGRGTIYDITQGWKGGTVEGKDLLSVSKILMVQKPAPISYTQIAAKQIMSSMKSDVLPLSQKMIGYSLPRGVAVSKAVQVVPKQVTMTSIQKPIVAYFPVLKQPVKQVMRVKQRLDIRQEARLEEKTISRQLEEQITKLMPKQIERQIPKMEEKTISRQIERQLIKPMIRQIERQIPKMEEKQVTKQITKQIEKQMLKQTMKQQIKTTMKVTAFGFAPVMYDVSQYGLGKPIVEEVVTTTTVTPGLFVLPDTTYKLFGHTMGQGYNVKIKERHIVKGKKIKEGKFIRVNKHPLSLSDAESLRGMVLDNSAAASGKVVPVNAMAQESLIKLTPFENISHKFYMKDDILIEKPKHRIDTKGEVKGISALGWYAEKSKKAEKKRQVVDRRPRARKQVDVFDMGMPDMLINMDKIFKGVMDFGF